MCVVRDSPIVGSIYRKALCDFELGGCRIAKVCFGASLLCCRRSARLSRRVTILDFAYYLLPGTVSS